MSVREMKVGDIVYSPSRGHLEGIIKSFKTSGLPGINLTITKRTTNPRRLGFSAHIGSTYLFHLSDWKRRDPKDEAKLKKMGIGEFIENRRQ